MLTGWIFKKTVSISPATGIDNLQVRVVLSSSNFDYSKCEVDGKDLRFTDSNDTLLNYWIESWNTSGDSIVWVKVVDSGTSSIFLYFGNSSASAVSNGSDTFVLFDDCSSTSSWTLVKPSGNPTFSSENGKIRVVGDGSIYEVQVLFNNPTTETEYVVHMHIKAQDGLTPTGFQQGIALRDALNFHNDEFRWIESFNFWDIFFDGVANVGSVVDNTFDASLDHQYEVKKFGYKFDGVVDDSSKVVLSQKKTVNYLGFYCVPAIVNYYWAEFDNFFVRVHPSFFEPWDNYDASVWTNPQPSFATVSNGELKLTSTNYVSSSIDSQETFLYKTWKSRIKVTDNPSNTVGGLLGFIGTGWIAFHTNYDASHNIFAAYDLAGTASFVDTGVPIDTNYHEFEIVWTSTGVTWYIDGVQVRTVSISSNINMHVRTEINARTGTTVTQTVDWVKVERSDPVLTLSSNLIADKNLSDSFGFVESFKKFVERNLNDSFSFVENFSIFRSFIKILNDSFSFVESFKKSVEKNLNDSFGFVESSKKSVEKNLNDSFSFVESFKKSVDKILNDSFGFVENFSISRLITKILNDSFSFVESFKKSVEKNLNDSFGFVESSKKSIERNLNDSFGFVETFKKSIERNLNDSFGFVESSKKSLGKNLSDSFGFVESFKKKLTKKFSNIFSFTENFFVSRFKKVETYKKIYTAENKKIVLKIDKSDRRK